MKSTLFICSLLFTFISSAQWNFYQYFDGADTLEGESLFIELEDSTNNIWQIGEPQKSVFDEASTTPNALVTDTLNSIPDSNYSAFVFGIHPELIYFSGVIAVNWNQKLDFEEGKEFGFVEFSLDTGNTWFNIFSTPEVYNVYGHEFVNEAISPSGETGFTGQDTAWKNLWFCIWTYDFPTTIDTMIMRFRIETDTAEHDSEGWMIDNIISEPTFFHTLAEKSRDKQFTLYPTLANTGEVRLKYNGNYQQENNSVWIYSAQGSRIYENLAYQSNESIDVSALAPGKYFVRIKTGDKNELHELIIQP